MADTYPSMTALKAATVEGVDYGIVTVDNNNSVLISGIHGGGIEIGVSESATLVQEIGGYDLFLFEGLRSSNNSELHVTSTNYDEPTMVSMVTDRSQHVAIHGASGDTAAINVGGLDIALRNAIWEELRKKGLNAQLAPTNIIGEEPNNVSNRNRRGGCCQLELTSQQRKEFFKNGDWSKANRSNRENWTPTLYAFAEAIVIGIERTRNAYQNDRYTTYSMDFYNNLSFGGGDDIGRVSNDKRLVHLRLSISNGVPTIIYRKGSEYIESLKSVDEGMLFTLKNVPAGTIPFHSIKYASSEGFKIDSTRSIGFDYMRSYGAASLLIGLKESPGSNISHTPMSTIKSGVAEIKIDL
ncbi:poly-gamma-glutamate hydrolase family protein [Priestia megaterium]|uniref:poly-gamma-glutamate hydrolase family protein n=1 Tax=Priestia megaterium TaxID=1404 RepID=UPI003D99F404